MSFFFRTTTARLRMVDTLKVRTFGTPRTDVPTGRRVTLPNGVRLHYDGCGTIKAEAELPKLLWGHNGCLIANQRELDAGVSRFRDILAEQLDFTSWELVLLDLVWQFETRPADVILAHQWLRFPGVRAFPSLLCGGKEIAWRGSRLALKFYEKASGVLRVELRLAGKQLRKRIDGKAPLNFAELYQVFRAEVLKLATVRLPEARKHSLAEIVATVPAEFQNDPIITYQQGRTVRAVSRFKRDVSMARLKTVDWNLGELLPANHPPPPVNCEPRRRRDKP